MGKVVDLLVHQGQNGGVVEPIENTSAKGNERSSFSLKSNKRLNMIQKLKKFSLETHLEAERKHKKIPMGKISPHPGNSVLCDLFGME